MKITLEKDRSTAIGWIPPFVKRMGLGAMVVFTRLAAWLGAKNRAEKIVLSIMAVGLPVLVFYNLGLNPRPWHDEGAALQLARTLAEDGVYAMRNSDGYQTFGPVQSVGPTVILPVALVYRIFGAGLVQGRVVVAVYTLAAILLLFLVGRGLFDGWTAILGMLFLLAAPGVRILMYGREVLGEIPGLAYFLAGWLAFSQALRVRRLRWTGLAGLLFGAAIITKSQYLVMIPATLGLLAILDLIYYRQHILKALGLILVLALGCGAAWQGWQLVYFGPEVYQANLATLRQLAAATTGFRLPMAITGIRYILGSESGNFYQYWGFPALGFMYLLATQRNLKGLLLASLALFASIWLVYFTFWIIPWPHYALPAMALAALFVARLVSELVRASISTLREYLRSRPSLLHPPAQIVLAIGTLIGLLSYGLWIGFSLQKFVRSDVLDRSGDTPVSAVTRPHLQYPGLAADYLEQQIPTGAVIETWERELGILTDLNYHFPDQSMLAYTHSGKEGHLLGEAYFKKAKANYVVLGWFARYCPVYDLEYLEQNGDLIFSIGEGEFNYDIYRLND